MATATHSRRALRAAAPSRRARQAPSAASAVRGNEQRVARLNVGRTFADKDRPDRWYVVLIVDGCWSLVWWEDGVPHEIPTSQIKRRKVRLDAFDFPMNQLLARWGISARDLDAFLEQRMYRWDADVREVRNNRQPLNGRTTLHVRHRHKVRGVRGG